MLSLRIYRLTDFNILFQEYDDYLLDKLYDDVNNIYEDILGDSKELGTETTTSQEDTPGIY